MDSRLLKTLKSAAVSSLLISISIAMPLTSAYAEVLSLFRSTGPGIQDPVGLPRSVRLQPLLKLDEKGDLLIQYGKARFTVAYNEPADQFKPSGQQFNPQREQPATINGISLTACITF